jgi:hypothetical protein
VKWHADGRACTRAMSDRASITDVHSAM